MFIDILRGIGNNLEEILKAATSIIGGFAVLAAMTPNKSDDRVVQVALDVVNSFGFNFGKAKNTPEA